MNDLLNIVAKPHPFKSERFFEQVKTEPGETIYEILLKIGVPVDHPSLPLYVELNGISVERSRWGHLIPNPGDLLIVKTIPMGGGGEKNPLRTILTVALIVGLFFVQPQLSAYFASAAGGALTGAALNVAVGLSMAAITSIGMLAINALAPPPTPKFDELRDINRTTSPSLGAGGRNQILRYGYIPRPLGTHLIVPPYAAPPFTEISGSDQYLRLVFCLGYGPLAIHNLCIGNTPIDEYEEVEYEIRNGYPDDTPITLYPNQTVEESLSIELMANQEYVRTTSQYTDEISLDFLFPNGLFEVDNTGQLNPQTVDFLIQYSEHDAEDWSIGSNYTSYIARESDEISAPSLSYPTGKKNAYKFYYYHRPCRLVLHKQNGTIHWIEGPLCYQVGTYPLWDSVPTPEAPFLGVDRWDNVPATPSWAFSLAVVDLRGNATGTAEITADDIQDARGGSFWSQSVQNSSDFIVTPSSPASNTVQIAAGALRFVLSVTAASASTIRKNVRIKVPSRGQYDIKITRTTANSSDTKVVNTSFWSVLRSINNDSPFGNITGIAFVAMRIRATGQLQGILDTFNCIVDSIVKDWDSDTETWVTRVSSNCASLFRHVLQDPYARNFPTPDSEIDLPGFQDWHDECKLQEWQYNSPGDYGRKVIEVLSEIAAAGRATYGKPDGKFTPIMDNIKTNIVQHFTPRNSWGFRGTKRFNILPHAYRFFFTNEEKNWEDDERLVYNDGYNATNATFIEDADLSGVTNPKLVYKHGRRMLAELRLRPETYELFADFEHLICTKGDRVQVTHDVTGWGLASGRVKEVFADPTQTYVSAVQIDSYVTMASGTEYKARFRKKDLSTILVYITTVIGSDQDILYFDEEITLANGPEAGDLFMFGEIGYESQACILKEILPEKDLSAKLILMDYAPGIQTSDTTIPAFDSGIHRPMNPIDGVSKPVILSIRSNETVLVRDTGGILHPRFLITLYEVSDFYRFYVNFVEYRFRLYNQDGPWVYGNSKDVNQVSITGVESGKYYDLAFRYHLTSGENTLWTLRENELCIGTTSNPPDIEVMDLQGDKLVWVYPVSIRPLDFQGFEVRYYEGTTTNWDQCRKAHEEAYVTDLEFDTRRVGRGIKTFMVKAVDFAKNKSVNPAIVTKNLGEIAPSNILYTEEEHTGLFSGTKDGCYVDESTGELWAKIVTSIQDYHTESGEVLTTEDGETLSAEVGSIFWTGNPSALFWSGNPTALFWSTQYTSMYYEASYTPTLTDPVTGKTLNNPALIVDWTAEGDSIQLTYKSASMSGYLPFPGILENITEQEYAIRISIVGGNTKGKVTAFTIKVDVPDIHDNLEDVVIGSGGTRLPITKTFARIKGIRGSIQDFSGNTAVGFRILDKDEDLGPLVECIDGSLNAVAGLIDVDVWGY